MEDENSLGGGFIISGRSNSNNGSLSDVWELELKSKSVESFSRLISELKFVGVFVKLENLEDLSNNIEIVGLLAGLLEFNDSFPSDIGGLEKVVGPLSEGLEDSSVLSLDGGSLSGEGIRAVIIDGEVQWGLLIS